jgi:hypothetical protein
MKKPIFVFLDKFLSSMFLFSKVSTAKKLSLIDFKHFFVFFSSTENISLKQFKPANIAVGLYLTKEEKKSKGRATFISELEGAGPLFDVNMFINESLFNRLFSSIENSGNDFLFQLKFSPFLLVSDLKNISEFNTASSGKGCNITDYKIEFLTNNY